MKLIVAGGRDFNDRSYMLQCLSGLAQQGLIPDEPELVCGMARGADLLAHSIWSQANQVIHEFPANWSIGKSGGPIRNSLMGKFADAGVCFWDDKTRGTAHMIDVLKQLNKPCWVFKY